MRKDDPRPLQDVLKGLIRGLRAKEGFTKEEIQRKWKLAVGKRAALHTRPVSLRRAVLSVNVDRSSWLYELTVKKREILKKLEGRFKKKKIKDIRFRIGEIKER